MQKVKQKIRHSFVNIEVHGHIYVGMCWASLCKIYKSVCCF